MNRLSADLTLLGIAIIWGLAFVFQKTAMEHIGPFTFLAARSALAALVLAVLAWRESGSRGEAPAAGFYLISVASGAVFFVGAILQQMGLVTATVTNSGFLTGLYVVITPLMMWSILGQRPRAYVWPAVGLAFAGTWMLGGGTIGGFSTGDWLVALSALFWAAHILVVAQAVQHGRPIGFTAIQFAVVAAIASAGAALGETVSIAAIREALVQILFVGLLSSALTFTLLAVAMRHTPAGEATILISMETVFAAIAGMLLLGERLATIGWVGAVLMLAATLVVQAGSAIGQRRTAD